MGDALACDHGLYRCHICTPLVCEGLDKALAPTVEALSKSMAGCFPCPDCTNGFVWRGPTKYCDDRWIEECSTCEGTSRVITNRDGRIVGGDKPPRYLCDHGQKLTEKCIACFR